MVLTSQDSGTSVLQRSEAGLDLLRQAIPKFLGTVPVAKVGRIVAEGIAVLGGGGSAGGIEVRRRPREGAAAVATRHGSGRVVVDGKGRLWSSHGGIERGGEQRGRLWLAWTRDSAVRSTVVKRLLVCLAWC